MTDYFKMFIIAVLTSVAVTLLLTPYVLRLQGLLPGTPGVSRPIAVEAPAGTPLITVEKLTAPNLEGMPLVDAQERWRDRGLVIVADGERNAAGAEPGAIVQQRPAPGAALGSEKEIRVIVAKASETTPVPAVVGQPLEQARTALVAAGFEVGDPAKEASDKPKGSVIQQFPGPNAPAARGSIVRLVVAESAAIAVPKVQGLYLAAARTALQEAGLMLGKVRRVEHAQRRQNYVLRQTPAPGESVPPATEVELVIVAPD